MLRFSISSSLKARADFFIVIKCDLVENKKSVLTVDELEFMLNWRTHLHLLNSRISPTNESHGTESKGFF